MGIKSKKFKFGDLVVVKGSEIPERYGLVIGPGKYANNYIVLFTSEGIERQFHGMSIRLISSVHGEKIIFNKNV